MLNAVALEIHVCWANSFTVWCLSSLIRYSVMATNMSVLLDTEYPLRCMSAVDTSAYKYVCPSCNSSAWSPIASCSCAWHLHACLLQRTTVFMYEYEDCCILQTSIPEQGHQRSDVCTWNARAVLYVYPNMMVTSACTCLQHIDSIFCIAKRLPWLTKWVVYNYGTGD